MIETKKLFEMVAVAEARWHIVILSIWPRWFQRGDRHAIGV